MCLLYDRIDDISTGRTSSQSNQGECHVHDSRSPSRYERVGGARCGCLLGHPRRDPFVVTSGMDLPDRRLIQRRLDRPTVPYLHWWGTLLFLDRREVQMPEGFGEGGAYFFAGVENIKRIKYFFYLYEEVVHVGAKHFFNIGRPHEPVVVLAGD